MQINPKILTAFLCIATPYFSFAHDATLKETIAELQQIIDQQKEKGAHEKKLALAYYRDQDLERAFRTFLKALDDAEIVAPPAEMSHSEDILYREALKFYLNSRHDSPQEIAETLKTLYGNAVKLHPDYYHLGYLLALAYANLNHFDQFFDQFYNSYLHDPEHFLAYKTKAILHIKLHDMAKTPQDKEKERQEILKNLRLAKKRFPKDLSLYKMEIAFSEEKEKSEAVKNSVKAFIEGNFIIPRTELPFYFDQLLAFGHLDLARQFLQKAREWYPYSRTLDAAQELINRKQKE